MTLRLSHSRLAVYQSCEKKYQLQYERGIQTRRRPVYFDIGTAFHNALESWYQGFDRKKCISALSKVFDESLNKQKAFLKPDEIRTFEVEKARTQAMFAAYTNIYKEDFNEFQKFICEKHIEVQLTNDISYHGYIDVMCQDAAGDWWIMETKTVAANRVNADYFKRVKIDHQSLGYAYLAKEGLDIMPRGVIYNVIVKTQHRQRQRESLQLFIKRLADHYLKQGQSSELFIREEVPFGEKALKRWARDTRVLGRRLLKHGKIWVKNTNNCSANFGTCPYFSICTSGGKVDSLLYTTPQERKNGSKP